MAAQDLAIKLSINADTAEGRAALNAFAQQMGQLPGDARTASSGLKAAFADIRESINQAFTFSAGQLIADGLQGGIQGVKQFTVDSIKEFRAFEDAVTGVAKTTEIKGDELKGLSDQLRQSAIDLQGLGEGAATQMANIAEIAGQLGIASEKIQSGNFAGATEEIAGFAEVIAKAKIALPEFTGGVEEVATSTAKTIQLYQQTATDAEAILSTYNELSNTTAANAKQIASFMESFTMAPQLKVSIEESAGLAATLISMGQDANDAATRYQSAITNLLKGTDETIAAVNAALEGNADAQTQLEEILGRSKTATEDWYSILTQAIGQDAVGGVNALIDGIGAIPDSVQQSQASTEAFGQIGARIMNTLINKTDTLRQNVNNASEAYKAASSVQSEFETAISKQGTAFDSLKTKVEDIKIEIGENLVTALSQAAQTDISPAIDQFSNWLKTSQEAETFFKSTLPAAISGVSGALSTVAQKGAEAANKIAQIGTDVGTFIGDLQTGQITLGEVGAALGESLGLSQETTQQLMTAATQAGQSFASFYESAKTGAANAVTGFQELYEGIASGKITLADIAAAGDEFFAALTEQFGLNAAYDAFQTGLGKIKDGWATWKADSEGVTAAFFDGVVQQFGLNEAYDAMQSGLAKLKAAWGLDWSEWTAAPKAAFLGLWEETTAAGSAAFADLKSGVASALAGMGDAIAQPFRDGAAAIENAFTGLGAKIGKEFETAKQKALDFYQSVTKNETLIGLFEKVTDKVMGVPPAMDEATAAQDALTESIQSGIDALNVFGGVAYGNSVYPDATAAIQQTQEAQRGLTDEMIMTTEQVSVLGGEALATFSQLADMMSGIGGSLSGLGGSLGDLGGLLGIKELGGLGGFLGDISKYAEIPSMLGDIGGQLGGLFDGLGSLGGLGESLGGIFGGLTDSIGGLLGGGGLGGLGSALGSVTGMLSGGLGSALGSVTGMLSGGLGGAVSSLTGLLSGGLSGAIGSIGGALGGLGSAIGGLLPALGPIGLAGGAIALAWKPLSGLFKSIFGEAQSEGNKANEAMRKFLDTNISGGAEMASAMQTAYDDMKGAGFDYQTFLGQTGTTFDQVFGGISQNWEQGATSMDIFTQAVGKATGDMQKAPQVALQMMASFTEMGLSAEEAGAKMLEIAEASGMSTAEVDALRASLQGVSADLSGTSEEGSTAGQIFDIASQKAQGLRGTTDELSGSLSGVTDQLSGAGAEGTLTSTVFDVANASAGALDDTVSGLSGNVSDLTQHMTKTGVEALSTGDMFKTAASSASGLQSDMDALTGQTMEVNGQLATIKRSLDDIPAQKEIEISVKQSGPLPALASGGIVGKMGLAIVNERGPEIARFPSGAMAFMTQPGPALGAFPAGTQIIPHARSMDILRRNPTLPRMADGGTITAGKTITINIGTINAGGQMSARELSQALAERIRGYL